MFGCRSQRVLEQASLHSRGFTKGIAVAFRAPRDFHLLNYFANANGFAERRPATLLQTLLIFSYEVTSEFVSSPDILSGVMFTNFASSEIFCGTCLRDSPEVTRVIAETVFQNAELFSIYRNALVGVMRRNRFIVRHL